MFCNRATDFQSLCITFSAVPTYRCLVLYSDFAFLWNFTLCNNTRPFGSLTFVACYLKTAKFSCQNLHGHIMKRFFQPLKIYNFPSQPFWIRCHMSPPKVESIQNMKQFLTYQHAQMDGRSGIQNPPQKLFSPLVYKWKFRVSLDYRFKIDFIIAQYLEGKLICDVFNFVSSKMQVGNSL